jgi:hypothetical protein
MHLYLAAITANGSAYLWSSVTSLIDVLPAIALGTSFALTRRQR